jgi:DNA-directed RNA polymerase beta' subunit
MVEAALGKIAAKTGKAYNVSDFDSIDDLTEFAIKELQKHNIPDLEDITDPETGRKIKQVFTGNRFFMKLHHTSESKGQGRGTGGYTMDATPAKGGEAGSKRISLLDNNALLSHGATEVLRDAGAIRGQRNEEFWLPFMQGLPPPKPKVPFVYEKFVNELRGSGINVIRDGNNINIMALTDKDVNELAGDRFIKSGDTVQFEKGMKPVAGGLFDPALTGGNNGNRWAAIKLHEPMPNPVMEEPIRRLLNLTQKDFEAVIAGKKDLRGASGPKAIAQALNVLNVDKEIAVAREMIKTGRASHRDQAVRKLAYLKAAKSMGLHPKDWLLTKAPVIPPIFRPVAVMSNNKMPLVADANYLYKELLEANNNLAEMSKEVDDVGDERLAVYKAFKAVTGLGDPVHPKLQEKNVKGLLKHIFGSNPKVGTVQRRLISSTVDLVGRAVITPNPDLDMDHVGLPEERAWDIYKNFIVRRLKRRGMPMIEAVKAVGDRTDVAKQELLKEMEDRPVVINRAPVLHRFGIMAFYPKLVKGDTLQISPLIVKGFGADFDGDAMQYHVPVSDEAKQEAAERMLPSRNLLSPADFKSPVHMPSQEYTGGLYQATAVRSGKKAQVFRNIKDVLAAYRRGEIEITDAIELLE